jgi:response regulator RpfG family c-di-GMP phosphodiesterase
VLTSPLKTYNDEIVGVLQLINAKDKEDHIVPFSREDEPFIKHFANNAAIAIERAMITRDIILRMIKMAELRDPKETGPHVNRVASYSVEIYESWASRQNVDAREVEKNKDILRMAAMLHDVGKVAITDLILKKPTRLDDQEYEVMKQHTFLGARLFSERRSDFDEAALIVTLNHHERWDGNGYPGHIDFLTGKPLPDYCHPSGKTIGKRGEEIPPFGRIVAIADVYDALSSVRSYKQSWDETRVLETLHQERGRQFDPKLIDIFLSMMEVIRNIASQYPDEKG